MIEGPLTGATDGDVAADVTALAATVATNTAAISLKNTTIAMAAA